MRSDPVTRTAFPACLAKVAAVLLAVLGTLVPGPRAGAEDAPDPWMRLLVLHTNDVHGGLLPRSAALAQLDGTGDVGGVAVLASWVAHERAQAKADGREVLLLDGGDVWRGTPEGDLTKGDLVVEAFGRLGYDAVALGNHDLDFGAENAARLSKASKFPWVSANVVVAATGATPAWLVPHVIREVGGVRIAIVGLTTPDTPRIVMGFDKTGLALRSDDETAAKEAKALEGQADVVIFLTHLGPERDVAVLAAAPKAPLVVGGHSHSRLFKPVIARPDGSGWVVQAGTGCVLAGRVQMKIHRTTHEVVMEGMRLVPLVPKDVGSDADTAAFLAGRLDAIPELVALQAVVATLTADLAKVGSRPEVSSPAGNAFADATRLAAHAEVGLANRGGIRVSLPKGPVTKRDLYLLMPFDNTVVDVPLTGAELKAVLTQSLAGPRVTPLEVSGVLARYRRAGDGPHASVVWTSFEVAGAPLDEARVYHVAVNSFLAQGGDGYGRLSKPRAKDTGLLLRDALRDLLAAGGGTFTPDATFRLTPE